MNAEKCSTCGMKIQPDCDYRQGRCPHNPSMVEQILNNPHYMRFHNLLKRLRIIK